MRNPAGVRCTDTLLCSFSSHLPCCALICLYAYPAMPLIFCALTPYPALGTLLCSYFFFFFVIYLLNYFLCFSSSSLSCFFFFFPSLCSFFFSPSLPFF